MKHDIIQQGQLELFSLLRSSAKVAFSWNFQHHLGLLVVIRSFVSTAWELLRYTSLKRQHRDKSPNFYGKWDKNSIFLHCFHFQHWQMYSVQCSYPQEKKFGFRNAPLSRYRCAGVAKGPLNFKKNNYIRKSKKLHEVSRQQQPRQHLSLSSLLLFPLSPVFSWLCVFI